MEGCLPLSVAILRWGCTPEPPASRTVSEHTFLLWNSRANVLTRAGAGHLCSGKISPHSSDRRGPYKPPVYRQNPAARLRAPLGLGSRQVGSRPAPCGLDLLG